MAKTKKSQKKSAVIVPIAARADGLAVYAESVSRGRIYDEAPSKTRGDFERDRDRIIHSAAFRRLKFKTQVFVYHEGDHYRTRLSHSIEVAQVSRSLARLLKVNEDLAETCALAHDLGHTPFAHVGEDALKESMQPYGGFDHNDQTLRIVTKLEKKYPGFDGLNLTWESLEGLIKHGGPAVKKNEKKKFEVTLNELRHQADFKLSSYASLEAQIAGISDDIAYNSHDIDDGLSSGIFTLKDLSEVSWVGQIIAAKKKSYPGLDDYRLAQETIRDVMGTYILDVLSETKQRLETIKAKNSDDIRAAGYAACVMSDTMRKRDKDLRAFLWARFYRSPHVSRLRLKIFKCVQDLFSCFMDNKRCLPIEWQATMSELPKGWTEKNWHARVIADYIASMTDRKALMEHRQLFDTYQDMK